MVFAIAGVVFVVLMWVGWYRHRHGEVDKPLAHWTMTQEVFIDPSTGRHMRVWLDADQTRKYVPEK